MNKLFCICSLLTQLMYSSENEQICYICSDNFENELITYTTPCNHEFHLKCIRKWVNQKPKCPFCRTNLSNYRTGMNKIMRELLLDASKRGDGEAVHRFIAQGADVNDQIHFGTPLMIAARNGHINIVKILLEKGADVNVAVYGGKTALHIAAGTGNESMVNALLEKHPNSNAESHTGETPLMIAAQWGCSTIVQRLLTTGANPELKNSEGKTAFQLSRNPQSRELLATCQQDRNELLIDATRNGDNEAVERFAEDAHINGDNKAGERFVKDADVNGRDSDGYTALMLAAFKGCVSMVQTLLDAGADANLTIDKGKTAFNLTVNQECRVLLKPYHTSFMLMKEQNGEKEGEKWSNKRKRNKM